jgi:hypothetical protein
MGHRTNGIALDQKAGQRMPRGSIVVSTEPSVNVRFVQTEATSGTADGAIGLFPMSFGIGVAGRFVFQCNEPIRPCAL